MKAILSLFFTVMASGQTKIEIAQWMPQESGTNASLRGVSAVSALVVWASGTGGTFLRTIDGGARWTVGKLPGVGDLDFRAIRAFDSKTAITLSIGPGEKSRLYKTRDGGGIWNLLYTNPDPKGFFDALAFWDSDHGILLGDPVDGHFVVMTTSDGGATWAKQKTPAAMAQEGAFAASNSCLTVRGAREVWFGTGGPDGARVFHSTDGGQTWTVAKTPIRNDGASAGIFALAFSDSRRGIVVGGDYNKPADTTGTIAMTQDGGKTWWTPLMRPNGFRSDVKYIRESLIATGTSGSDWLDGSSFREFNGASYNALGVADGQVWAVGPKGAIAKLLLTATVIARNRARDFGFGIASQFLEHR